MCDKHGLVLMGVSGSSGSLRKRIRASSKLPFIYFSCLLLPRASYFLDIKLFFFHKFKLVFFCHL